MAKKTSYVTSADGDTILSSFVEISVDPVLMNNFSNEESMGYYLNSYNSTENFQKLKNDLYDEVMDIIQNHLTDRQRQVTVMTYIDGKTQNEIATELGVVQTTAHKTLRGNIDYVNGGKRYGGALKKIRKLCKKNERIQEILKEMRKVYEQTK